MYKIPARAEILYVWRWATKRQPRLRTQTDLTPNTIDSPGRNRTCTSYGHRFLKPARLPNFATRPDNRGTSLRVWGSPGSATLNARRVRFDNPYSSVPRIGMVRFELTLSRFQTEHLGQTRLHPANERMKARGRNCTDIFWVEARDSTIELHTQRRRRWWN
jgi:hypothetical protein